MKVDETSERKARWSAEGRVSKAGGAGQEHQGSEETRLN